MQEGSIVLVDMVQSDGSYKLRPALILKKLPKFDDYLLCGISTQLHQCIKDVDEILNEQDNYFKKTGLRKSSLIRLLFLAVISNDKISGSIGEIPVLLHKNLLQRLANFLTF